jgi:hypothetical protein
LEEGVDVGEPVAPDAGCGTALPGLHPGAVRLDGVDLTVVGQGTERLGVVPTRKGVGREALVEDRERRLEVGVAQVPIEVGDTRCGEEPLVDDGVTRRRWHRETTVGAPLHALAGEEQGAFELVSHPIGGDDGLLDERQDLQCVLAQAAGVDGHRAPQDEPDALGFQCLAH